MTAGWKTASTRLEALAHVLAVRGRTVAALGVVALLAASVLQRIDLALSAAHLSGGAAGGVGGIASPARFGSTETALRIAAGWAGYQDSLPPGVRSVPGLLAVYLAADLVLMSAVTALLLLWWSRALRSSTDRVRATSPRSAARSAARALADAVRWAWVPVALYLPADVVETALATGWWRDLNPFWARAIAIASVTKWVALLLAAVPLLLVEISLARNGRERFYLPVRGELVVAGLLVAAFLALSGDLGLQVDDLLIRAVEDLRLAVWATLFAAVCGAALNLGGRLRLRGYRKAPAARALGGWWLTGVLALGIGALLAGIFVPQGHQFARWTGSWHLLAVLGGLLVVFALTSLPKRVRQFKEASRDRHDPNRRAAMTAAAAPWLDLLAAVPLLVLALAVTRAATSQAASGKRLPGQRVSLLPVQWSQIPQAVRMTVWVAVLLLLAWFLVTTLRRVAERMNRRGTGASGGWGFTSLISGAVGFGLLGWQPGPLARIGALGAPGLIFLFATLLALVLTGLVWLGDVIPVRGSLAVLGLRRIPWIALMLSLTVAASLVDREGVYYDALTQKDRDLTAPVAGQEPTAPLIEATEAFTAWTHLNAAEAVATGAGRPTVSLVFVAAAGGGIKAAYWTAAGMSCAFGDTCGHQDVTGRVFLASGVSGSSLGLAAVRGHRSQPIGKHPRRGDQPWYDNALDGDFVSPSVAAFLFRDLPNSLFRLPFPELNRASALQDAWEAKVPGLDQPFYRPGGSGPTRLPFLALTGTSVEDGCRLSVSNIQMAPAAEAEATPSLCAGDDAVVDPGRGPRTYPVRDAAQYLCDRVFDERTTDTRVPHNIRLSTAALLSARFPYVSPSGDLARCGSLVKQSSRDLVASTEHTYVVDGGLFDNSGATAINQVWEEIESAVDKQNGTPGLPCVVPRLLVLDNHFDPQEAAVTAQRPLQATAPPSARDRVYDLRSSLPLARAEANIRDAAAAALLRCKLVTGKDEAQRRLEQDPAVVQLHPVQRPGSKAPLGWTLSGWSRADMTRQLTEVNCPQLRQVWAWFPDSAGRQSTLCRTVSVAASGTRPSVS